MIYYVMASYAFFIVKEIKGKIIRNENEKEKKSVLEK